MTNDSRRRIAVWDTSALSRLAALKGSDELIAQMRMAHDHWVPRYVLDEIASTSSNIPRDRLLCVCRKLTFSPGRILPHPADFIRAGVLMFDAVGLIDWEILLESVPEYQQSLSSKIFDDNLARTQHPQMRQNLELFEEYCVRTRPMFTSLFADCTTVNEVVGAARSKGVLKANVAYYCSRILGHEVDSKFVAEFSQAFPPIESHICAFLAGHFLRKDHEENADPVGALDLMAAAYLPTCDLYVSDDHPQQQILRDVVKSCSFQTEVVWFNGGFRKRFRK
jgi:hypothetical protein